MDPGHVLVPVVGCLKDFVTNVANCPGLGHVDVFEVPGGMGSLFGSVATVKTKVATISL